MFRLETVALERETSLRLLQTGQEKGRPGAWRSNVFGYVYWWVSGTFCSLPDSWTLKSLKIYHPCFSQMRLNDDVHEETQTVLTDLYHCPLTGIDSKSTPFPGIWTEGTSGRNSTHQALCNRTSGEMRHTNAVAFLNVSGVIFCCCALSKSYVFCVAGCALRIIYERWPEKHQWRSKLRPNSRRNSLTWKFHHRESKTKAFTVCQVCVCVHTYHLCKWCAHWRSLILFCFGFFLSHVEYLFNYWNYALSSKIY